MSFSGSIMRTSPSGISAAARYVKDGYRVYPAKDKRPLTPGWLSYNFDASKWPEGADVGILTGRGLLVVDIDGASTLHESLHELLASSGCAYYKTTRGAHYYFRVEGLERPCKAVDGVDFQHEGRGVIAPPSLGREWVIYKPFHQLPSAPSWLLAFCRLKTSLPSQLYNSPLPQRAGDGRNNFLHLYLIKYASEFGGRLEDLEQEALAANRAFLDPLPQSEVLNIVKSVMRSRAATNPTHRAARSKAIMEAMEKLSSYFRTYRVGETLQLLRVDGRFLYHVTDEVAKQEMLRLLSDSANPYDRKLLKIVDEVYRHWYAFSELRQDDILVGDANTCYFFFKNCIFKLVPDDYEVLHYDDVGKYVFADRVIQREFTVLEDRESVFETFVKDIFPSDFQRATFALGKFCSGIDAPEDRRALLITDGEGDEKGGRGKSLFAKAISHCRAALFLEGEGFSAEDNYKWDQVTLATEVVVLEDVNKKFALDRLKAAITDCITVNRKFEKKFTLPADKYKIVVTSNTLFKLENAAERRRVFVLDASKSAFTERYTPREKYGHTLFDDWDDAEWSRFYTFIFRCVMYYMQNRARAREVANAYYNAVQSSSERQEAILEAHKVPDGVIKVLLSLTPDVTYDVEVIQKKMEAALKKELAPRTFWAFMRKVESLGYQIRRNRHNNTFKLLKL